MVLVHSVDAFGGRGVRHAYRVDSRRNSGHTPRNRFSDAAMPDPTLSLADLIAQRGASLPSAAEGSWVRTELQADLRSLVESCRLILVLGPPRSGKSTLALGVARDVCDATKSRIQYVHYLDLTQIEEPSDIDELEESVVQRGNLLVVDHWHARPDCHEALAHFIQQNASTEACIILLATRFREDTEDPVLPAGLLSIDTELAVIETDEIVQSLAEGMVRLRLMNTGTGSQANEDDQLDWAMRSPLVKGTSSRNLRVLAWRLDAWQPGSKKLSEVTEDDIRTTVRKRILAPAAGHVGTLERVAALSQWEVPLERRHGENEPAGIDELVKKNVIFCIREHQAWMMDPTDAHLCLLCLHPDESPEGWLDATATLIRQDMPYSASSRSALARGILSSPNREVRLALFSDLNRDASLMRDMSAQLLAALRVGSAGPSQVFRTLDVVSKDLPESGESRSTRLASTRDLLQDDLLEVLAERARHLSAQTTMWLLIYMKRGFPELRDRAQSYLQFLGRDAVVDLFRKAKSPTLQRKLLRLIARVAPDIERHVYEQVRLLPLPPTKLPRGGLYEWLARGTTERLTRRHERVEYLAQLDRDQLQDMLKGDRRPAEHCGRLLNTALWLAPDEGRRLGAEIATLLPMPVPEGCSAQGISWLVHALNAVSPTSAAQFVERVLAIPVSELFSVGSEKEVGFLLSAVDKITRGSADAYVLSNRESFQRMIYKHSDAMRTGMLGPICVLSGDSRRMMLDAFQDAITGPSVSSDVERWAWEGLEIASRGDRHVTKLSPPAAMELAQARGVDALLALHALVSTRAMSDVVQLIAAMTRMPLRFPFLPGRVANHLLTWTREEMLGEVRRILRMGGDPRAQGMRNVALASSLVGELRWPKSFEFHYRGEGGDAHRAIQASVADGLISIRPGTDGDETVASIRDGHPIAKMLSRASRELLEQHPVGSWMTLQEWDSMSCDGWTLQEQDYWRGKLIQFGAIDWKIEEQTDPASVRFSRRAFTDRNRAYECLSIPIPRAFPS